MEVTFLLKSAEFLKLISIFVIIAIGYKMKSSVFVSVEHYRIIKFKGPILVLNEVSRINLFNWCYHSIDVIVRTLQKELVQRRDLGKLWRTFSNCFACYYPTQIFTALNISRWWWMDTCWQFCTWPTSFACVGRFPVVVACSVQPLGTEHFIIFIHLHLIFTVDCIFRTQIFIQSFCI